VFDVSSKLRFKGSRPFLVIVFSLIFLALIELFLHLFPIKAWQTQHHVMDRYLLWKGKPYATGETYVPTVGKYAQIRLNSMGFRSPEVNEEKEEGSFRIVCMGDSSTFGMESFAEDTYPMVLQRLLEEKYPERKIEVINAGYTGYSSFQGLILLKRKILNLKPDLITIFYGVCDNTRPHSNSTLTDREYYEFNNSFKGKIRAFLTRSKIYLLLEKGIVSLSLWLKTGRATQRRDFFEDIQETDSGRSTIKRVPVEESERNFKEMVKIMIDEGIVPVIIKHYWLTEDNNDYSNTPYHEVMDRVGHDFGVSVIDTRESFESACKRLKSDVGYYGEMKRTFPELIDGQKGVFDICYIGNVHPSAFGHYLIAQAIAEKLVLEQSK